MTLLEGRTLFREQLSKLYQTQEIDFYYKFLLEHVLSRNPIQLALNPNERFDKQEISNIKRALNLLIKYTPLQYITGEAFFRDLKLRVSPKVLIPRPETEELVDWILKEYQGLQSKKIRVLDLGTGSGCIAIALAKEQKQFLVSALDIDPEIISLAKENALNNKATIEFRLGDMTQLPSTKEQFDILVSNPPYVMQSEKKQMKTNVLNYEPHQALFVPQDDPLLFYRCILDYAEDHLVLNGSLFFEINPLLVQELNDLIRLYSYRVSERMDIFGKVRMLRLQKI